MPADFTRDPESMTEAERRDEVASILARGLVRSIVATRARTSRAGGDLADCGRTCLELPGDLPLSVAPRPGGTGPGGTGPSGSGSSNCLLYGTIVTMADGRRVPIEMLAPGELVASLVVPGLKTDVPFGRQYEWMSTWGLAGASLKPARLSSVQLGEHDGFFLINGRIKATFEHPFLIRREHEGQDAWGFCAAELLRVGDILITRQPGATGDGLAEEPIVTVERIAGRVRTVALCVPGTNTFLADGAWTHNTFGPSILSSTSGSSSSSGSSSGSKSSGSSFSGSSSGSPVLTQFSQTSMNSFTFGASGGGPGMTGKG